MTKKELDTLLKYDEGNHYFSFSSELELEYLLNNITNTDNLYKWKEYLIKDLVIDVYCNNLYDWGKITDSYYKDHNRIIHHLDFSTREEENIELTVTINDYYTGKLSIPFEALQELKKGAKLKLL